MKPLLALAALGGLLAVPSFASPVYNHTIVDRQVDKSVIPKYYETCLITVIQYMKPRPGVDFYVLDTELRWQERGTVSTFFRYPFLLSTARRERASPPKKNQDHFAKHAPR